MLRHPRTLTEDATLDLALQGANLARYGDGELRVALGGACISQKADPRLTSELQAILRDPPAGCLPCIPNPTPESPKAENWKRYAQPSYLRLYSERVTYGSAFVTRPDSAPWIDRLDYWDRVRATWRGKHVTLVIGCERSLRADMLGDEPASLRIVWGTRTNSYGVLNSVERDVGEPRGTVIACLGCAATVLAARLARKGVHCIDLGHVGMFMRAKSRVPKEALAEVGVRV